jgi:hypothetical protein
MQLLVRNKVADFATWREYLEADRLPAAEYKKSGHPCFSAQ